MLVAVTEECTGTGGCSSKSAALRCAVKQSCEGGAVPHTNQGNPLQRSDGHLTPEAERRLVTYPARGHATGRIPAPVASHSTTKRKGECAIPPNPKGIEFPRADSMRRLEVQFLPLAPKRNVAQSGSALALGASRRGFKSRRSDSFRTLSSIGESIWPIPRGLLDRPQQGPPNDFRASGVSSLSRLICKQNPRRCESCLVHHFRVAHSCSESTSFSRQVLVRFQVGLHNLHW